MNALDILRRFESLAADRFRWENIWQTCSDFCWPSSGQSNKTNYRIFDSTASLAKTRFAAAMESVLVPRTQVWHSLVTGHKELDDDLEVQRYLQAVRGALFSARYVARACFADQLALGFLSLGVQGTTAIFVDDDPGVSLLYKCIPAWQLYIAENSAGRVDTVFRAYELTARQARQEFGDELPGRILRDLENSARMDFKHEFLHCVFPRRERGRGPGALNMPFASVHIARADKMIVRESGYRTMPYAVSRYSLAPGEVYGDSPAKECMPSITGVNDMKKTTIVTSQRKINPPMLVHDKDAIQPWSMRPGALNYGGVNSEGRQLVIPLETRASIGEAYESINDERKTINDAFLISLFQILVDEKNQTATEVMKRAQEKAQLLAPIMGRQQSELLEPIIEREIDILTQAGVFDHIPVPAVLRETGGVSVRPRYETAMARALDSLDADSIVNAFQAISLFAGADPSVLEIIDLEKAGRKVWGGLNAPADVLRSDKELAEIRAARAEQQAAMQQQQEAAAMVQALPALTQAAKTMEGQGGK